MNERNNKYVDDRCNNEVKWPLTPRHVLTERVGCTKTGSNIIKSNTCGIISETYAKDLLLGISGKLKIPTVLLEKVECGNAIGIVECYGANKKEKDKYEKWHKTNSWYRRTESDAFYSSLASVCSRLRNCSIFHGQTCKKKCHIQDIKAAAYFLENDRSIITDNGGEMRSEKISNKKYEYLVYNCMQTGFTEIAVPVRIKNTVCGVFITGQIALEDKQESIKQYVDMLKKSGIEISFEDIKNTLTDKAEFNDKVESILMEVSSFEKKLNDRLNIRCGEFLYRTQHELLSNFFNSLPKRQPNDLPQVVLENIIKSVCKCLKEIVVSFGLKDITLFTLSTFNVSSKRENLIGGITISKNGESNKPFKNHEKKEVFVDVSVLEEIVEQQKECGINEITKDNIKDGLFKNNNLDTYHIDLSNSSLFFAGVNGKGSSPVILLVRYKNKNKFTIAEIEDYSLSNLLFVLNNVFLAQLSTVYTSEKEQNLKNFIKTFTHETGQLNSGTRVILYNHNETLSKSKEAFGRNGINNERCHPEWKRLLEEDDYLYKSIDVLLKNIELRLNSAKYRAELRMPDKKYFFPYDTFLFKWNAIYSREMEKRGIELQLPRVRAKDRRMPEMYADPLMVEQVAYNLTNNAYKYAYDDTKIYLDCKLDDDSRFYILRVTNFGLPIDEDEKEKIFGFGFRSKNAPGHTEGNGIGLYLSKRIADMHGGTLELISNEVISDFTIPLMDPYLNYFSNCGLNKTMYNRIRSELEKFKRQKSNLTGRNAEELSVYEEIVNPNYTFNSVKRYFIDKLILHPTAKVIFEFKIPNERGV